jgi:hypothetical protein
MIGYRKRIEAERLRGVVECLPYETRVAMLEGLRRFDRIIVGAYTDRRGGVCPMLAAHRCGGRTDYRSFARAWDRFTGARRSRRASERELRTLIAQLEASVWREEDVRAQVSELGAGAAERQARATPPPRRAALSKPARKRRYLGSWLVPFRRWDGYREAVEAATRQVEESEAASDAATSDADGRPHALR